MLNFLLSYVQNKVSWAKVYIKLKHNWYYVDSIELFMIYMAENVYSNVT